MVASRPNRFEHAHLPERGSSRDRGFEALHGMDHAKERTVTNDKKLNAKDLAKVQGGKGRAPARASGGRATGSATGKGSNLGSKRR